MKTLRLTAMVLLLLCAFFAHAEAPSFDQANRLYEQGKYRDATEAYEALLQRGTESTALWFNLGNAQFKAGHVGDAIAAYRKAEQLAPRDPDVRANLDFARRQVTGPSIHPAWFQKFTKSLTTNEWTLAALVPLWILFVLLIAGQLNPSLRTRLRRWCWISGAAAVLGGAVLVVVLQHRLNERVLVVNSRDTVVRAGPFEESPSSFTASDGAEFALRDAKGDWYQISDGNKPLGWLKTNAVVALK